MELKVKADEGQQIWLSKEDIYHGSLILVNSVSCSVCDWYYFDDTGFRK